MKMPSQALVKGKSMGIATVFRLLIVSSLLSGGLFVLDPSASSSCMVLAQGGADAKDNKENAKNNNVEKNNNDKNNNDKNNNDKNNNDKNNNNKNNNDKNNNNKNNNDKNNNDKNKQVTESPTSQPTTGSPTTGSPTLRPTTGIPTTPPTYATLEATLPRVTFEIVTVVDDVFEFAALLGNKKVDGNSNTPRDSLNHFYEDFFFDLLVASRVVYESSLDSLELDIKLLPNNDEDENNTSASTKSAASISIAAAETTNATPMRIVIEGNMIYHVEDEEEKVLLLEDKMSHTLAVYFSFWKTDNMVYQLSEYGLKEPSITAVRVDEKLILVNDGDNANIDGTLDGDTDEPGRLVVPSDGVPDWAASPIISGGSSIIRPFVTTMVLVLSAILASVC